MFSDELKNISWEETTERIARMTDNDVRRASYNATQEHIAAVKALATKEEVEAYDYTSGYPDKLVFNLNQ